MDSIYLDNAATTAPIKAVLEKAEKMVKVESKQYEAERDAALKTLGIGDEKSKAILMRLRETPRGL